MLLKDDEAEVRHKSSFHLSRLCLSHEQIEHIPRKYFLLASYSVEVADKAITSYQSGFIFGYPAFTKCRLEPPCLYILVILKE